MQRILVLNIYAARQYLSVLCVARQTPSSGLQTGQEWRVILGLRWRRCCVDRTVRSCGESGTSWIGALQCWFCWSTTSLRYKDACLRLQDRTRNVCICPRASASNGKRGQMQVICILLRVRSGNSCTILSALGPCETALVVQMKAFHYSDVLSCFISSFFPPVLARPDMIRHYQIQRRLLP
jgi:hypothetical protein